ncbi:sensor domain-containing diguanylate cyclase [Vibrio sp. SCSIO 43137]|uniref:sensor domain-containing diguanylate cyclase n=1 Tax=Vibrio sp. SCSIO 43137 TaxID=3021011 RepID=UPI0023081043|nr:sensor domain-containing diguanylate cyclase [Vibrio sp. SCSIO 43137]WCE31459.1 sensor domain-containing diguanylate cyclase [Vibrio sp. SCSIO 43137]
MFLISNGISRRGLLIVIIASLLIIAFVFTNYISYHYLNSSLRQSVINTELPKASTEAYSEIALSVVPSVVASSMMANDRFLRQWLISGEQNHSQLTDYLTQIKRQNRAFISFLVSAKSLEYYNSEGVKVYESPDDPQAAWYFDFIRSPVLYELNVGPSIDESHTPAIFINYKMMEGNQLIGVVGLGLRLSAIESILGRFKNSYKQNIYFIDTEGMIISSSHGATFSGDELIKVPGLTEVIKGERPNNADFFEYQSRNNHLFMNLRFIDELNWWMLIEQEEGDAVKKVRNILVTNIFIGVATIFVTLIIVSWIINYFHKKLEILATTDQLTGLDNRQVFEHDVKKALLQNERQYSHQTLLLIDVDRFKNINDSYGHLMGDEVLKNIAQTLSLNNRESDCLGRWGGEEFVLLAHNMSIEQGEILAEKIRLSIEQHSSFPQQITVSIGVTESAAGDKLETLLSRADSAMYKAKNAGRNCVRTELAKK